MAVKINGKTYRRVKQTKSGGCPKGATKKMRGKSRRTTCLVLAKKK